MNREYTTIQGDMWDAIAARVMGSVSYTGELMWANRRYLGLYLFPSGVVLTVPEVPARRASELPPWKQ